MLKAKKQTVKSRTLFHLHCGKRRVGFRRFEFQLRHPYGKLSGFQHNAGICFFRPRLFFAENGNYKLKIFFPPAG
jgi:hypothetical protein